MSDPSPLVGVIMGSKSDWETMRQADAILTEFGVPHECQVLSAHRTPALTAEYASTAASRGLEVIVAGAGGAAQRARLAAVDRADAEGHSRRDRGDRRIGRGQCRAARRRHPRNVPSGPARETAGL